MAALLACKGGGVWEGWIIKPNARIEVNIVSHRSGEKDIHLDACAASYNNPVSARVSLHHTLQL